MRVRVASLIATFLLVAACGAKETASPCTIGQPCKIAGAYTSNGLPCVGEQAYDNGQPVCSCTCAAGLGDAGADGSDAVAPDAGTCGSGPPGACNHLTNIGTVVTPTCVAGSAPAMTGGPIADGTYVLIAGTAYASSCSGVSLPTGGPTTVLVSTGCMQSIDVTGGAKTYTWTTSGNTLTSVEVCPGSSSFPLPYTATPTMLFELAPLSPGISVVSVFRKQ